MRKRKINSLSREGILLVYILVFGAVVTIMIVTGLTSYALFEHKASRYEQNREEAFHIAEAGINYYRWHLAHASSDYQDGTGEPGPYVHDFEDKDGNIIGQFSLTITPPEAFSSVVTIESTGHSIERPEVTRTIRVRLGYPSLANYAILNNESMTFSQTTIVSGEVKSNVGIEFNGTTNAPVYAANQTYDTGANGVQNGVWGTGGPSNFFDYPVPAEDFGSISVDLAGIRQAAIDDGIHLGVSNNYGWLLEFRADGYIDIYEVSQECWVNTYWGWWFHDEMCGTTTWSPLQTVPMPSNGLIFSDDKVWVYGTVHGRVTVAAGQFPETPSTHQKIVIHSNLQPLDSNAGDVIGLIAQADVVVPYRVPNDMIIHAAAISQFNGIWRPAFSNPGWGNAVTRNSLTFIGAQIGFENGSWKYGDPIVSGFINTSHVYDNNLRLNPPPGFPVGTTYEIISWEEL